jgi:hypothetical protein
MRESVKGKRLTIPTYSSAGSFGELPDGRELLSGEGFPCHPKFWDNDPDHPPPENGIKVMLGFPAFPANAHHDVEAENIKYAAPGVDAGLKALEGSGDPSRDYFQGRRGLSSH